MSTSTLDKTRATFWRLFSVTQTLGTLGVLLFASYILLTSAIFIRVEAERLPGRYPLDQLSDKEYIAFAEQFTNLLATYQFSNANDQLNAALNYLEPRKREEFRSNSLEKTLFTIQDTSRSQIFTIWDQDVNRANSNNSVLVTLIGKAQKQVGNKLITYDLGYEVEVSVYEGETPNPYGLIVNDFAELDLSHPAPESGDPL